MLLLLSALLLLWRTPLLLVWAWLHDGGRRRRRSAGRAAPRRGGGDQSRGGGHLGLICQAQLLEGEAIDGLDEGHARLACNDFSSGVVARISASEKGQHHLRLGDGLVDVPKRIGGLLQGLGVLMDEHIPLSKHMK